MWTAKEAAAKVRREGLRLDLHHAVAELSDTGECGRRRHPLVVHWDRRETTAGWWRAEPGWVMTVAAEPACPAPQRVRSAPGEPGPQ